MADYKLTVNGNGDAEYITAAGDDFVKTSMPSGQALGIIESASLVEKSDKFGGFEICVNGGEYYFAGKIGKAAKADEPLSEPEAEAKPKKASAKKASTSKK